LLRLLISFSIQRLDVFSFLSLIYILPSLIYILFLLPRFILSFVILHPSFNSYKTCFSLCLSIKRKHPYMDKKQAISTPSFRLSRKRQPRRGIRGHQTSWLR
jgi:hypothetical protein